MHSFIRIYQLFDLTRLKIVAVSLIDLFFQPVDGLFPLYCYLLSLYINTSSLNRRRKLIQHLKSTLDLHLLFSVEVMREWTTPGKDSGCQSN